MHARLRDLFASEIRSLDPRSCPNEQFELWSIPSYDDGRPEIRIGREIGSAKKCVKPNDVLLSRIVPHLRRAWVVGAEKGIRQLASSEWIVFRNDSVIPEYLREFLLSDIFHSQFMNTVAGVGGSLVRARPDAVGEIEIPLPPLSEQRRIAAILDQADALRSKREASVSKSVGLARAQFLALFGDPIANSKGWPVASLGEVGTLDRGVSKHRPRNDPILLGGPYPLIQTGDVAQSDGYIREFSATYSEAGLRQSRLWPGGTLCITIAANIGKTAILNFDACFPDSIVGFLPGPRVRAEYVQIWMTFVQKGLEDAAPQFAQKNINLAILRGLRVPVPPVDLQSRFTAFLTRLTEQRDRMLQHSLALDRLFLGLRHSLMESGKPPLGQVTVARQAAE